MHRTEPARPAELIEEAGRAGVETLSITNTTHDTFDGYDQAVPAGREAGMELICGIELSPKLYGSRSVRLSGTFWLAIRALTLASGSGYAGCP